MMPVKVPLPDQVQLEWHEQERIMFLCIDPCTWQGQEFDDHSSDLSEMDLPSLDTDQWCRAAVSWGAKEILFVAKHTGGFCWWQTDTTDYSVKNIPWKDGKGDLLEDLAKSCKKHGLNIGIYVYPGDESWGAGIGSGGLTRDPSRQEAYNEVFRQQLRESLIKAAEHTRVIEVWFDGSCVIEVSDILKEYAPRAVIFQGSDATIRWAGNEDGCLKPEYSCSTVRSEVLKKGLATQEDSLPEGDCWAPLEINTTLYKHFWFWSKRNERKRKSLRELIRVYEESAGQGAVMLLNATPNTAGLIPDKDMALYTRLGHYLNREYEHPFKEIRADKIEARDLEISWDTPMPVNQLMICENIQYGERVSSYTVEACISGSWKKVFEGRFIGRKRIVRFSTVKSTGVRLSNISALSEPFINRLAVYGRKKGLFISKKMKKPGFWRGFGKWSFPGSANQVMEIDLSKAIKKAGIWEVRLSKIPPRAEVNSYNLLQDGQDSTPGIITRVEGPALVFRIKRTAVVTAGADIRLHVTMSGTPSGGRLQVRRVF